MSEHYLNWSNEEFDYEDMVYIDTIGDGNCLFHAILQAFYTPYIEGYIADRKHPLDRKLFVDKMKKDFSENLTMKRPGYGNKTWYDTLSRGKLEELSKEFRILEVENLKKLLLIRFPLDNIFNEYISEVLGLDIYILDGDNKRVYIFGDENDLYYKGRKSIVLMYHNSHYSTVGVKRNGVTQSYFDPQDDFILEIKSSINKHS